MKNEILEFALSLAGTAEAAIMPVFRHCSVSFKSDGTEVTDADKRAEEVMREAIGKRYPKHLVLGEEFGGPQKPTNESLWVLDPIDGTTSFAAGLPIFGTLIAYLEGGEPQVGVIHFPAMGETVYAAKGSGCWIHVRGEANPQRVRVSQTANISDAFISAGGTKPSDIEPPPMGPCVKLSSLILRPRKFRFISDCVQHALVAQGRIDAAIDPEMNPWDIAALIPCVEEAGGVISDLGGVREHLTWQSSLLSSSTPVLHAQILRVLQGVSI
jgi:histidinol-phosphatase